MPKRPRTTEAPAADEPRPVAASRAPGKAARKPPAPPAPVAVDPDLEPLEDETELPSLDDEIELDAAETTADPDAEARNRADLELWQNYKATGDPKIREHLILEYTPFVKYIAGRIAMGLPPNVSTDDLISNGVFGLIDAIEKFQIERNVKFKTYAQQRIRGAILDNLRGADWVPRSVRTKAKQLERAYMELENRHGRPATDEEVAKHLGITLAELYKLFNETKSAFLVSLDEVIYGEDEKATRADVIQDDSANPQKVAERKELKRMLVQAIKELNERERLVLTLYYYEELTLRSGLLDAPIRACRSPHEGDPETAPAAG
jgi:RNA polymerase sigma factor for flagellar operon FliA